MTVQPGPPSDPANVFRTVVGDLPQPGELPPEHWQPYETITPTREGFVDRNGVKTWYAVWGTEGPWIAFAPIFQITHSQILKTTVPYLSRHFRVITTDLRGNGRSDRPAHAHHYTFDEYYADFVAVIEAAAGADRVACIALSATTMTAIRLAAELPDRVSHLIIVGGFADFRIDDPRLAERLKPEARLLQEDCWHRPSTAGSGRIHAGLRARSAAPRSSSTATGMAAYRFRPATPFMSSSANRGCSPSQAAATCPQSAIR